MLKQEKKLPTRKSFSFQIKSMSELKMYQSLKKRIDNARETLDVKETLRAMNAALELHGIGEESITADEFAQSLFPNLHPNAVALKGFMNRENLTQTKLAEMTKIQQGHISEMIRGKRPIGVTSAKKLAKAFGTSIKALL